MFKEWISNLMVDSNNKVLLGKRLSNCYSPRREQGEMGFMTTGEREVNHKKGFLEPRICHIRMKKIVKAFFINVKNKLVMVST